MINKFKTKKEVSEYLATKGIDTATWSEEKWLGINKGAGEIHIMDLAEKMYDALNESTPEQLEAGEWHIPYGDNIELSSMINLAIKKGLLPTYESIDDYSNEEIDSTINLLIKIATARMARISYETLGDNPKIDYEADIKLHDALMNMEHWSPFEHCARCMTDEEYYQHFKGIVKDPKLYNGNGWSANFKGFIQYRQILEEND